jgi:hypothetical protein
MEAEIYGLWRLMIYRDASQSRGRALEAVTAPEAAFHQRPSSKELMSAINDSTAYGNIHCNSTPRDANEPSSRQSNITSTSPKQE